MFRNRRQLPFLSALLFGLSLIACLPGGAAFAEEAAKLAQKAKPPAVTVTEAKKISFVDNVLVTGSLVPREEVLVGPEIDGYRLTELLAEEGDHVKKGQVLAKLSREILEAQLAQNSASLSKTQAAEDQVRNQITESEATLRQVQDAFNRVKPLREFWCGKPGDVRRQGCSVPHSSGEARGSGRGPEICRSRTDPDACATPGA